MASREEEKRLRREEREKAQAAAAASQSRAKRLQYLIGALIAIAAVVVVVLLVSGGSDNGGGGGGTPTTADSGPTATIPAASERDLDKAAKAADCQLLNPPIEGSTHVDGKVDYKSVPPTSGNHNATPALDGIYATGDEPAPENWVHALEHGRIVFQYKPGTPAKTVSQLETLANEPLNGKNAYKVLLLQNKTNMDDFAVAASAWGHSIVCKTTSDAMFDALRDFRVKYVDQGPEPGIPPNN
jgi:hypothetical protein